MNILWDFDGTLFNTYPVYTKLVMEVLGEGASEDETLAQLKISFGHAFRFFKLSEEQGRKIRQNVRGITAADFIPFPGVEEVLKEANINVIMTHKETEEVRKVLRYYKMEHYFNEIIGGDAGFPRKPDPASYEYLHNKYTIDLAIGDRALDLEPARRLGISTCSFQNHESEANFYLDDYNSFAQILGPYFFRNK